jgi:hypothetical protein
MSSSIESGNPKALPSECIIPILFPLSKYGRERRPAATSHGGDRRPETVSRVSPRINSWHDIGGEVEGFALNIFALFAGTNVGAGFIPILVT